MPAHLRENSVVSFKDAFHGGNFGNTPGLLGLLPPPDTDLDRGIVPDIRSTATFC